MVELSVAIKKIFYNFPSFFCRIWLSYIRTAMPNETTPELSLVIPVYNGSRTIGPVVRQITVVFGSTSFEIVLVDDGSDDQSETVCAQLVEEFAPYVVF